MFVLRDCRPRCSWQAGCWVRSISRCRCADQKSISLKTGFLKSASGESCPQQAAPDLRSELCAHSCELCSENILKFPLPAAFFLQVFNLSLQMKCAVEKKMLITQLLHSAPTTEKFITICPGLDRAVSIKTLTSLKQQLIASAMQQGTASNPQGPCQELVRVCTAEMHFGVFRLDGQRQDKKPCSAQNFYHLARSVTSAAFWCLMLDEAFCSPSDWSIPPRFF